MIRGLDQLHACRFKVFVHLLIEGRCAAMAFARSILLVAGLLCLHQACAREKAVETSKVRLNVNPIRRVVTILVAADRSRQSSETIHKYRCLLFVPGGIGMLAGPSERCSGGPVGTIQ